MKCNFEIVCRYFSTSCPKNHRNHMFNSVVDKVILRNTKLLRLVFHIKWNFVLQSVRWRYEIFFTSLGFQPASSNFTTLPLLEPNFAWIQEGEWQSKIRKGKKGYYMFGLTWFSLQLRLKKKSISLIASFLNRNCIKKTTDANFPKRDFESISFFVRNDCIFRDKISFKTSLFISSSELTMSEIIWTVEVFSACMRAPNQEVYSYQAIHFGSH